MNDLNYSAAAAPIRERMTRLEALFEAFVGNQLRRDEEDALRRRDDIEERRLRDDRASEQRRELARSMQSLLGRMDQIEPVILGDLARGKKPIDERIKAIEDVILSAKIGWRAMALLGTSLLAIASVLAYVLQWLFAAAWPVRAHH